MYLKVTTTRFDSVTEIHLTMQLLSFYPRYANIFLGRKQRTAFVRQSQVKGNVIFVVHLAQEQQIVFRYFLADQLLFPPQRLSVLCLGGVRVTRKFYF